MNVIARWWFPSMPLARVAVLRTAVYLFAIVDMTFFVKDVHVAGLVPELYQPLFVARLLHLPTPTPTLVHVLEWLVPIAALVAASGRLPRLAGWIAGLGYCWWLVISMSYGKVDHDHMAIVVAMLVLPTIGRARLTDAERLDERARAETRHATHRPRARAKSNATKGAGRSEAAGWALRCVQVGTIATYFLSAVVKLRTHGWTFGWPSGAVLTWAITRRPTPISEPLLGFPWLLVGLQWLSFLAELCSPVVLFLRRWALALAIGFWLGFHVMTWLFLGIHFLPTVVCWLAFVPTERLVARARSLLGRQRAGGSTSGQSVTIVGDQPVAPVRDPAERRDPEQPPEHRPDPTGVH